MPSPNALADAVWEALKARCSANPAKAKRLVLVDRADILAAVKTTLANLPRVAGASPSQP